MVKNNFDKSGELRNSLTNMETKLKTLRDNVGLETQTKINLALNQCLYLRDELWLIDKALEGEVNGEVKSNH